MKSRHTPPKHMWHPKYYSQLSLPLDFGKLLQIQFPNCLYTSYIEPKPHTHKGRKRPLKTAARGSLIWAIIVSNSVVYDYFNTSIFFSRPLNIVGIVIKWFNCRSDISQTYSSRVFRRQPIFNHLTQNSCSSS